jgi:hypothetical protein
MFRLSYPIICLCGESRLLVSWCVGDRCDMMGSDEDLGRSRRHSAEDWDGQAQVRYSVVGRSGGRVTPCAVCTVHMEMRSASFLVEPQNQGRRVSQFGPQNRQLRFGDLGLKITMTVSWFGPKNQAGDGLLVAAQNRWEEDCTGHVLRSSSLLCLEGSSARVSQFASKPAEERQRVVHVASLRMSHEDEVEDGWVDATGCIRLFYRYLAIFVVLRPRDILVFFMSL